MTECERIADQFSSAHAGPAWHGDSISEILDGVSASEAHAKPIPAAHSIWELLRHLESWNRFALEAIHGREFEVSADLNFPVIGDPAEHAWQADRTRFNDLKQQLISAVRLFPDSRLEDIVPARKYSFYFLFHGLVHHDLYHAGQMALLKKAIRG